jgi:hypothetical protein
MKTKNRFALVLIPAFGLLLLASVRMAAPVRAQSGEWEEFSLPEGYFPRGIRFFDESNGRTYGMRLIEDGDFLPFIFETTDGGTTWAEQVNGLEMLREWTSNFSIDLPQAGRINSDCRVSEVEELFALSPDEMFANALTRCTLRTGGLEDVYEDLDIFHTEDGGDSWSRVFFKDASGELMVVDGKARSFVPSPGGGVWLILYNDETETKQSFFSSDGEIFTPRSIADLPDDSIYKLEFPDDSFGYVLAYFEPGNRILVTLDGGETWTEVPLPSGSGSNAWFDSFFLNDKTGWVAGSSNVTWDETMQALVFPEAIYKTVDGGVTWEEALILGIDEDEYNVFLDLREVQFQNSNVGFALAGYDAFGNNFEDTAGPENILLGATDGGTMWELLLRAPFIACLETTNTHVYVCAQSVLDSSQASIFRMELPTPRPTPTPTFTPAPPTATPMAAPDAGREPPIQYVGAAALTVFFLVLIGLLLVKRYRAARGT